MTIIAYQNAIAARRTLYQTADTRFYSPFYTSSGRTSIYTLLSLNSAPTEENIKRKSVYELIPALYEYRYKRTPIPQFQVYLSSENALTNPFEKNSIYNCLTNSYTCTSSTCNTINFIKINKGINNIRGLLLETTSTNKQCSELIDLLKSKYSDIIGISIGTYRATGALIINVFVKEQNSDIIVDTIHSYPIILASIYPEIAIHQTIAQEIATLSTLAPKEYCEYITQAFNAINTQLQATQAEGLIEKLTSSVIKQKTKYIQSESNTCKSDINFYEEKIREFYKKLDKLQLQELGIREATKNLKTDLETITKRYSRHITLLKLNPDADKLKIRVNTTLRIYDEEQAKRVTKNMHADYKPILEKLFVSGKYTLLVQQDFIINFTHTAVEATCIYDTSAQTLLSNNNLPGNPHLTFHACFGQNQTQINKAITSLDFERLYTALIACASSMNLYDGIVVRSLGNFLLNCLRNENTNNLPIIYDEENQVNISLNQLMLEDNNETNNTEQG